MSEEHNPYDSVDEASSLNLSNSYELIDRARNGCDDALAELITSLQGYLLVIANRQLQPEMRAKVGASDLVQSVLWRAKQNLTEFRGASRQSLLAWLRRILTNEIVAAQRKYLASKKRSLRREVPIDGDSRIAEPLVDQGHSPHSDAVLNENAMKLRHALQKLSVDHRRVVILRNWEKMTFEDVGREMNRTADAAKKLWARAIRQLQKELVDENESF